MSTPLSPAEVQKIADLARLRLTDDEIAALARQLGDIVAYVAQLREVATEGTEPLAHALPVSNVFRDDDPAPSLPLDQALANAPSCRTADDEGFYSVPAVLE